MVYLGPQSQQVMKGVFHAPVPELFRSSARHWLQTARSVRTWGEPNPVAELGTIVKPRA